MASPERIAVELFQTGEGRSPFLDWLESVPDVAMRDRIEARLTRLRLGNPGDHRDLGAGLWELRLFFGQGYRIYFTWRGRRIAILLAGGTKGTQRRDIRRARSYLDELRENEP